MPPQNFFTSTPLGSILLQAAQGVVAQEQRGQQMQLQAERFKEQVKEQDRLFSLKKEQLDLQEQNFQLQQQKQQALLPVQREGAQAQAALARARAEALGAGGAGGGRPRAPLTSNEISRISSNLESRAREVEANQVFQEVGLPLRGSVEAIRQDMEKMKATIQQYNTSENALINQARNRPKPELITSMEERLKLLQAGLEDPRIGKLISRHSSAEGASAQTKQSIAENLFPPDIVAQINFNASLEQPAGLFEASNIPESRLGTAWDLFDQGNTDVLADLVLETTGGAYTEREAALLQQELQRRDSGLEGEELNARRAQLIELHKTLQRKATN